MRLEKNVIQLKEIDEVYYFENKMYLLFALRVLKQKQCSRGVLLKKSAFKNFAKFAEKDL